MADEQMNDVLWKMFFCPGVSMFLWSSENPKCHQTVFWVLNVLQEVLNR